MSKYNIRIRHTDQQLEESNGICVKVSHALEWAVGKDIRVVTDYCRQRGWAVIPVIEDKTSHFEFHGTHYLIDWQGNRILRITAITDNLEREITWQELPQQIKELI